MRDYVLVYVNGIRHEVRGPAALMMAADWLRRELDLPGTKIVCAEGDCGACTILRALPAPDAQQRHDFIPINSCIATVAHLDCSSVVTVEGLQMGGELSPVQTAMRECHASQCGYCTPGFVMAMSGLFEKSNQTDARTAANYLTGNLCRCTGYAPIIEAAQSVRQKPEFRAAERYLSVSMMDDLLAHQKIPLSLKIERERNYYAPVNLESACQKKSHMPAARVIGSATDLGVSANKGRELPPSLISLRAVADLHAIRCEGERVWIGANASLSEIRRALADVVPEFARFLDIFASPQIKNAATLIGNIANASPIGDSLPFLLAVEAELHLASWRDGRLSERVLPITQAFAGYRKLDLAEDEIISAVSFVAPKSEQNLRIYKASQRKDLDISAVSAAFLMRIDGGVVVHFAAAFGGVAATPVRIKTLEDFVMTKSSSQIDIEVAVKLLDQSIQPLSDVRGSAEYRRLLAANLLRRYWSEALSGLDGPLPKSIRGRAQDSMLPPGVPHA